MTTPPWLRLTLAQVKRGWIEMKGVTPVHHEFQVIKDFGDGTVAVRNPKLIQEEEALKK